MVKKRFKLYSEQEWYNEAAEANELANLAWENLEQKYQQGGFSRWGAILQAFSIELLLKLIQAQCGEESSFESGHHLKEAFEAVNQNEKEYLENQFKSKTGTRLNSFLEQHDNLFPELRYWAGIDPKLEGKLFQWNKDHMTSFYSILLERCHENNQDLKTFKPYIHRPLTR